MKNCIKILNAKEHNLKNISLEIPHKTLTVFTGVSGSGKSSLAFDTIFQEGQRRYLESLSSYARQFLGVMNKADVEHIEGLSPTVSIDQKSVNKNPRSTVGTVTEIYDFLRLFFARLGIPYCSQCGHKISKQSEQQIAQSIIRDFENETILILAPIIRDRKGEYRKEIEDIKNAGYIRMRIDGIVYHLENDEIPELKRYEKHTLEIVLDRIKVENKYITRMIDNIERATGITHGLVAFYQEHEQNIEEENESNNKENIKKVSKKTKLKKHADDEKYYRLYTTERSCANCGHSIVDIEPNLFSFNNPMGACTACNGLGVEFHFSESLIVDDENLSIEEGALKCFVDGHIGFDFDYGMNELEEIAKAYNFNINKKWKNFTDKEKKYLLYGTDKAINYTKRKWGKYNKVKENITGILTRLKRNYEKYSISYYSSFMEEIICNECNGSRINKEAMSIKYGGKSIANFSSMTIEEAYNYFLDIQENNKLKANQKIIGEPIVRELIYRLTFLMKVGLSYLSINRTSPTLSGGESQRIRLAAQIGSGLEGVLYVLDEPSIGLHQSDNKKLIDSLKTLRDKNNTVIVVEHDRETMEEADFIVDIGPDAGVHGGEIVGIGSFDDILKSKTSHTAKYLRGDEKIEIPKERRKGNGNFLTINEASQFNLKNITVSFPLATFIAVTGLSGSGKSTLIENILMRSLFNHFYNSNLKPGKHNGIDGIEHIDKVIEIDQSPIGRTPRSNPATYTKLFSPIRDLFAGMKLAKMRGYDKGRFSFNVKTGRCPSCEGAGVVELEMQFLSNVSVVCEECAGKRFNQETLDIKYKNKNIYEVLEMSVSEAREFFDGIGSITRILDTMLSIGLGYIKLGQPSTTLSGGEAQRIKLASELHKIATGNTFYVLDEPTTGLHFEDIKKLLKALQSLVDKGNTVLVIEHNLDVIKCADYIVDLGPTGGAKGGYIITKGTPEHVSKSKKSLTSIELKNVLEDNYKANTISNSNGEHAIHSIRENTLVIEGARKHNLKNVSLTIPKNTLTVVTGVSGSGKTSLAFDTIFSEGQRKFVESLSTYARRFLGRLEDASVEKIQGLAPAIAIDQKNINRNPRSTVATVTEIYDYLRLIYARISSPHCSDCKDDSKPLQNTSPSSLSLELIKNYNGYKLNIIAPLYNSSMKHRFALTNSDIKNINKSLKKSMESGYMRIVINKDEYIIEDITDDDIKNIEKEEIYSVGIVVDRIIVDDEKRARIAEAIEKSMEISNGIVHVKLIKGLINIESYHTKFLACLQHGVMFEDEITPRHFSFNSHWGYCEDCKGIGTKPTFDRRLAIADETKPMLDGALDEGLHKIFSDINKSYTCFLKSLMKKHGIKNKSLYEVAYKDLDDNIKDIMFDGDDIYRGIADTIVNWYNDNDVTSDGYSEWKHNFVKYIIQEKCSGCNGERLNNIVRSYKILSYNISELCINTVEYLTNFFNDIENNLSKTQIQIAKEAIKEIKTRLSFLEHVGLYYLTLNRGYSTLSGGEAQRIRLASQLGSKLTGVLYVLDEPTVGLHPRDTDKLLTTLNELRDIGNTLIVVEHDKDTMKTADHIVDMGPYAGEHGGEVIFEGKYKDILKSDNSLTAKYLNKSLTPVINRNREITEFVKINGCETNNLKNIDVVFPLNTLTVVTGVSGSGKSSLVIDTLYPALINKYSPTAKYKSVENIDSVSEVILVDQISVQGSIRSTLVTYTKIFDKIRMIFSKTKQAKILGFKASRFSYNNKEGRCNQCDGKGIKKVAMHFLSDLEIVCETCHGSRYNEQTLGIKFKGLNISEVLNLTVDEAISFFDFYKPIHNVLVMLSEVGLGYIRLSQRLDTFSGGEKQRLKLSRELSRNTKEGHTIYILDEPTTGLHFDDIRKLVITIHKLIDNNSTAILVEHHPDVMRSADHIIDMGLEGGYDGGSIIVEGNIDYIKNKKIGYTYKYI